MPKISSGILGPYSGTIGNVTGYRRNGKNVIQAKPLHRTIPEDSDLITISARTKVKWSWIRRFKASMQNNLTFFGYDPDVTIQLINAIDTTNFITDNSLRAGAIQLNTNPIDPTLVVTGTLVPALDRLQINCSGFNAIRAHHGVIRCKRRTIYLGSLAPNLTDVLISGNTHSEGFNTTNVLAIKGASWMMEYYASNGSWKSQGLYCFVLKPPKW